MQNDNKKRIKYSFFYRVQGGKPGLGRSKRILAIKDGKIEFTDKRDDMLFIGTRDHMLYFLRKRTKCHRSVNQILRENTLLDDVKNPVEVYTMVVPTWFKRLIGYYGQDPVAINQKYQNKERQRVIPYLTDISTPGDCYGISYYLKELLSEVTVYATVTSIQKQQDIIQTSNSLIDMKKVKLRETDKEKISSILCDFNNRLISLNEDPIPNRIIDLIEQDVPDIKNKIQKGISEDARANI